MNKRPLSVTVIGCLFIAVGVVALSYHLTELRLSALEYDLIWVLTLRFLALLAGAFLLRGHNWARWLLLAWLAYHVVLSAFHSVSQTVTHTLLLAVIAWFLLRRASSDYFCHSRPIPKTQAKSR